MVAIRTPDVAGATSRRPHSPAPCAFTFDTSGFTQDQAAFEMVNSDGTPCGANGPCTITVGEGETLWVTWHLEYVTGAPFNPGFGATCEAAAAEITASARLVLASDASVEVAPLCGVQALGYNK